MQVRVGVDLWLISAAQAGGTAHQLRTLVAGLVDMAPDWSVTLYCTESNAAEFVEAAEGTTQLSLPEDGFIDHLDRHAGRGIDVLIRPFPGRVLPTFPPDRQAVLVPDLQHEVHPEFFAGDQLAQRRRNFDHALSSAGAIVTISSYSATTIRNHPRLGRAEVVVVPPALQPRRASPAPAAPRADDPYLLYPANLWPHKNHGFLLDAFARYRAEGGKARLVLTGNPYDRWDELGRRHPVSHVEHLGHVADADLDQLYAEATGLVLPSLYEGFGLPVMEAFAAAVPVITSNRTSLPEVAGDAAILLDPTDTAAWATAMHQVVTDDGVRAALIERGLQRAAHHRRDRSIERLAEVLGRLAGAPAN